MSYESLNSSRRLMLEYVVKALCSAPTFFSAWRDAVVLPPSVFCFWGMSGQVDGVILLLWGVFDYSNAT